MKKVLLKALRIMKLSQFIKNSLSEIILEIILENILEINSRDVPLISNFQYKETYQ